MTNLLLLAEQNQKALRQLIMNGNQSPENKKRMVESVNSHVSIDRAYYSVPERKN